MDTPPPVSLPASPPGSSLQLALARLVDKLPATALCAYALKWLGPLLSLPYADQRWIRGLYAFLTVVAGPSVIALSLSKLLDRYLTVRSKQ